MALVAIASAKGAPGVSVTAAALAAMWPRRCVLADLDPLGSDVALRYRDSHHQPLDTETGVLSLAVAVRRGELSSVEEHLQTTSTGMEALVGFSSPGQVTGVGAVWPHIASSLRSLPDADVIADCGRVAPGAPTLPVIERADVLVMVTRSTLEEVAHLRERLVGLRETLRLGHLDGTPVGVVVVTDPRDTQSAGDTERLLQSSGVPVVSLGAVADDSRAAEVVRTGSDRSIRRSLLLRSIHDVAGRLDGLLTDARHRRELAL
jgi:MinD-like ATPase involved in chromosome partitioning or flagellar assembly